ncbi:acylase [Hyphomonas jannaschiana]|uniref:Penicillin amidase n=1 Tax=Hyphomonas jannaschiana VP2 TaxID=1280952 RepID=A0A059F9G0_9PROT|nr:acylase [Hyphomonas jannaschiana]KCZ87235.1 penicillin amidase [Hyphomonas jannaschiana VP2]
MKLRHLLTGIMVAGSGAFLFACAGSPPAMGGAPEAEGQRMIAAETPAADGEILWDTYGVPHIYGTDAETVFYGYGYAQANSHANTIFRLYGEARGKGAEYWGAAYEDTTKWLIMNGVPERAQVWYDAQDPEFRRNLDAFADGMNAYAEAYPEAIDEDVKMVLPITGVDVVAHAHRLMNFVYVASPNRTIGEGDPPELEKQGSNTWAVAPSKTASGNAMLLQNPHLPWSMPFFIYYEAHLVGPDFEVYGATQVGLPVIRFAFNQQMGISNTVNGMVGATTYELTLRDNGYLFDGKVLPFDVRETSYKLLQDDGTYLDVPVTIRSTVHGPVFERPDGKFVALRVAGLDRPGMLNQYFDMVTSDSYDEFHEAISRLQVPTFNISYADRDGHIEYIFNGMAPRRTSGDIDFWKGLVPGDTSEYLWTEIHDFEDLPRVTDPESGFIQNSNDPPWEATLPVPYKPEDYPSYFAPRTPLSMRAQNSLKMMTEHDNISFDEFVDLKLSAQALMADRVLPDLLAAASGDDNPDMQEAVELLSGWDRTFSSDNRAGVLFEEWAKLFAGARMSGQEGFAIPWSDDDPINTPSGLRDPEGAVDLLRQAITSTRKKYGMIDPLYGDVSRFILEDVDVPGHSGYGNLGSFDVITWSEPNGDGVRTPAHGETWVALIEFSTPIKAYGRMSYGNSRQPGTTHYSDQLELLSQKAFRELWLQREQVEEHLERRTTLNPN